MWLNCLVSKVTPRWTLIGYRTWQQYKFLSYTLLVSCHMFLLYLTFSLLLATRRKTFWPKIGCSVVSPLMLRSIIWSSNIPWSSGYIKVVGRQIELLSKCQWWRNMLYHSPCASLQGNLVSNAISGLYVHYGFIIEALVMVLLWGW